ncbi:HTH CENPB-type domain-containing protein [Trichonephila inaurata madagascariensis]|uniref:HTH CENPB-type domain-containing protein n=1 Tax=Trichonephila inaurata madagascariensis TaxID=2747483 RepID=A0A8X6MCB6_9ARAC|nr:HTH CENPB-type domain-containing protein [Trichonephila inaurata madagascariensis]
MKFLKNHFIHNKGPGKALLILDGHASHWSDVAVSHLTAENNVTLFYHPSHITQNLQSLDRSFFKPLKTYWRQALSSLIHNKPDCKVSRLQFGSLLNAAWSKAATVGNGTSGFSATGIYPYNPQAILQHAFAISHGSSNDTASTSKVCDLPTPAVASTRRFSGSGL